MRTDPEALSGLAGQLQAATDRVGQVRPAPQADAGPSSAALAESVAGYMRALAGFSETTARTVEELHGAAAEYARREESATGLFQQGGDR